jgi:hypothetical protein
MPEGRGDCIVETAGLTAPALSEGGVALGAPNVPDGAGEAAGPAVQAAQTSTMAAIAESASRKVSLPLGNPTWAVHAGRSPIITCRVSAGRWMLRHLTAVCSRLEVVALAYLFARLRAETALSHPECAC